MAEAGVKPPLFVVCLLVAILVSNIVPRLLPAVEWPMRSRPLADLGSLPQYLPGDVADGHAALDAWRTRPIAAVAYIVFAVFPTMGGELPGRGDVG